MSTRQATVDDLAEVARIRARAEAAEVAMMLRYRESQQARITRVESPMRRLVETSTIPLEIGQALGLSEGQVVGRLATADRVLGFAPRTWTAFQSGDIDYPRLREISLTLDKLERPESKQKLDLKVVSYAESHTVSELRSWLKRFVRQTETDLALERANAEREKRYVEINHTDDGMSWLTAYLPSHQAAAIASRLRRDAKALGANDERTQPQRKVDLFVDALLNNPVSEDGQPSGMKIDIAVVVDAPVLTGLDDGHAASPDGSWEVPADWILDSALVGDAFWHRLLVDPIIGDTLAHQYIGYSPPDTLRRAITFRDGICTSPGCQRPAAECDLDHVTPWPEGPTRGDNLASRCRRHHSMKGHDVLERVAAAHHARQRAKTRARHKPAVPVDVSVLEHRIAWYIADHS